MAKAKPKNQQVLTGHTVEPVISTVTPTDLHEAEDSWYDEWYPDNEHHERPIWVKPSAYVPGTLINQLREPLAVMLQLGERESANLSRKLFRGVRPETELRNEQTPRSYISKTQTASNCRMSTVNGMAFYSRQDLLAYTKRVLNSYEHYEVVGGLNNDFIRDVLHQAGYVHRSMHGSVFTAPFKTKYADSVLCFVGTDDVPTAEFIDVVIRNVPAVPVAAADVPPAFYKGKRRVVSHEEREWKRQAKAERKRRIIQQAAVTKKVNSYRFQLEMGIDPVTEAQNQLATIRAVLNPVVTPSAAQTTPPDVNYAAAAAGAFDENLFDNLDGING